MSKILDYSDYISIVDTLEKSDIDDVYVDLMKKEDRVLDTVNNLVRYEEKKQRRNKNFLQMSIHELYTLLFLEIPQISKELERAKRFEDVFFFYSYYPMCGGLCYC